MKVIGLAGWSGAGKTTLLLKLLPEFLPAAGLRVSRRSSTRITPLMSTRPARIRSNTARLARSRCSLRPSARFALMCDLRGEPEPSLAEHLCATCAGRSRRRRRFQARGDPERSKSFALPMLEVVFAYGTMRRSSRSPATLETCLRNTPATRVSRRHSRYRRPDAALRQARSRNCERHPAFDRVGGIAVARRRGMACRDEPVDQHLVFDGERVLQRANDNQSIVRACADRRWRL